MAPDTIQPGDLVNDRDDPEPDDAIVVTPQSQTAAEWDLAHTDGTLADDNPDYSAETPAITVVYVADLIEYGPPFDPTDRTPLSMQTLNDSPVRYYTFPAPRLAVIESPATGLGATEPPTEDDASAPDTPTTAADDSPATETAPATADSVGADTDKTDTSEETAPSPALQQLKTTLETEGLTVELTDATTLTVERLGQTYAISPDGAIQGDGALRSQLESIVADTT